MGFTLPGLSCFVQTTMGSLVIGACSAAFFWFDACFDERRGCGQSLSGQPRRHFNLLADETEEFRNSSALLARSWCNEFVCIFAGKVKSENFICKSSVQQVIGWFLALLPFLTGLQCDTQHSLLTVLWSLL